MPTVKRQLKQNLPPARATQGELKSLLGPAPLIEGEDRGAYDALHREIHAAVSPKDAIEEIWVRDVVDLLWETLRLRRLKVTLMRADAHEGLAKILTPLVPNVFERNKLVSDWVRKDQAGVEAVNAILQAAGIDAGTIAAQTFAVRLDAFERIDRLLSHVESRRNAILREVQRRREAVARVLSDAATVIEDAEYRALEGEE